MNCADLLLVQAALGKKDGDSGHSLALDVNNDGAITINDFYQVKRGLPAGTECGI